MTPKETLKEGGAEKDVTQEITELARFLDLEQPKQSNKEAPQREN